MDTILLIDDDGFYWKILQNFWNFQITRSLRPQMEK